MRDGEKIKIQMVYVDETTVYLRNGKAKNYFVLNVTDVNTGNLLFNQYVFIASKIFEKRNIDIGDIVQMEVNVECYNGYYRFTYPKNIKVVGHIDGIE